MRYCYECGLSFDDSHNGCDVCGALLYDPEHDLKEADLAWAAVHTIADINDDLCAEIEMLRAWVVTQDEELEATLDLLITLSRHLSPEAINEMRKAVDLPPLPESAVFKAPPPQQAAFKVCKCGSVITEPCPVCNDAPETLESTLKRLTYEPQFKFYPKIDVPDDMKVALEAGKAATMGESLTSKFVESFSMDNEKSGWPTVKSLKPEEMKGQALTVEAVEEGAKAIREKLDQEPRPLKTYEELRKETLEAFSGGVTVGTIEDLDRLGAIVPKTREQVIAECGDDIVKGQPRNPVNTIEEAREVVEKHYPQLTHKENVEGEPIGEGIGRCPERFLRPVDCGRCLSAPAGPGGLCKACTDEIKGRLETAECGACDPVMPPDKPECTCQLMDGGKLCETCLKIQEVLLGGGEVTLAKPVEFIQQTVDLPTCTCNQDITPSCPLHTRKQGSTGDKP